MYLSLLDVVTTEPIAWRYQINCLSVYQILVYRSCTLSLESWNPFTRAQRWVLDSAPCTHNVPDIPTPVNLQKGSDKI